MDYWLSFTMALAIDWGSLSHDEEKWQHLHRALSGRLAKAHVYCKPFLVGWYNDLRRETARGSQLLDLPEDTLAFLLYSGPGFIDTIVEYFMHHSRDEDCHYVDGAVDALMEGLISELPEDVNAKAINLDKGPPYFHAQSLGVVAGVGQHLDPAEIDDPEWHESISKQLLENRSPEVWGTDMAVRRKMFGISVHPEFGGWYAYRGVVVLHGIRTSMLMRPPCIVAVQDVSEKKRIIEEYNLRADDCRWRDLLRSGHSPDKRYSPEEMLFFSEMNLGKRRRFLEMKVDIRKVSTADGVLETFSEEIISERWGANSELVDSLHRPLHVP